MCVSNLIVFFCRRPAYISFYNGAILRSVTTHIEKAGQFWDVRVRAHFESSFNKKAIKGYLSATLSVDANESIKVERELEIEAREDGTVEADLNMTISEVRSLNNGVPT